ncbi:DUF349 domain-containing protein [Gramella sp. BOM4]|nr:DUF349 domain-containing protein [Christiangramia bathymodioli]
MSQQENENKKKGPSEEESKKADALNTPAERASEEGEEKMSAKSVDDQTNPNENSTSDKTNSTKNQEEIESTDHEDAMLDESAAGKATSDLKAKEKKDPDSDPYTDLEEQENPENPFFKEPEIKEEEKEESKAEKKISNSTDHEDAMVSESESASQKQSDEAEDEDDLDSELADAVVGENKKSSGSHQEDMDDAVAEDSEDESANERHDIEKKDYHSMSKEELADELERLLDKEKVQAIKEHVAEIRAEFNAKFDEDMEEKKEEFLADGGNIIDFHYSTPLKKRFNSLYFDYKERRNNYYKRLKKDLNENLSKRLEIIEELKGLLGVEENINTTYNHFKEIQDKWRTAGPIPRDKYNNVWNTYHHHVENFYDFLHLNREFRDLDFKHNLEQKLKVIDRAEELVQETDVNRAFRELQMLHKMWKEELGPVAKEYREDIWDRFSTATKKIHDKRQEYFEHLDEQYEKNWEKKQEIIEKIKEIADQDFDSHNKWQQKIKEIEALREEFFKAGKVPRNKNQETWNAFKENVRRFNRKKNAFYKNLKKQQYENLEKKKELIQIAEDNKDSDDFKTVTPLMKKIQADWKKIGHVPRKDSDKVWKQFKKACNHYFDRLHAQRNEDNKEELEAFDKKKEILDKVKSIELTGEKKADLAKIKEQINAWKEIGRVPYNKRFIEGKFNKALDQLFKKIDIDHTKAEMLKYENKVQALDEADDDKKIRNEHYFLSKKIEETKAEIRQLENNLQFFSNVDDDNPLVQEVHKNIENHKADLEVWEEKLRKIKSLY